MKKIVLPNHPVTRSTVFYIFLILIFSGCGNNATESNTPAADTTTQNKEMTVDFLPSWNDGDAKQAILKFVHATTDSTDSAYVKPGERIATFDQDGTLWVEYPVYTQLMYCLDRVPELVKAKPALKNAEPFKTVLSGNWEAIGKLKLPDLEKIAVATLTGMTESQFKTDVKDWVSKAKDHRWNKLYIDLTYQPMLELMHYLRNNGYKTYIVTGGGQDFVRAYADQVYGIPAEQVVGTAASTTYKYDTATGKSSLLKNPKLVLNDNGPGKAQGIQLIIGHRPNAAFGNSTGDQQMLEYTKGGSGTRLAMLVLHDDSTREYAYGPAQGLPAAKVGIFTQDLYDQAKKSGWIVISMKNDWKTIFK
ncbi:MAG TPA: HAD family hydrolase [Puia sp.]|jgi:phosphoglycolate phosphatase-like HAD superfamily hydrolase|nr:HAD family hydrolase [Puia sp.]